MATRQAPPGRGPAPWPDTWRHPHDTAPLRHHRLRAARTLRPNNSLANASRHARISARINGAKRATTSSVRARLGHNNNSSSPPKRPNEAVSGVMHRNSCAHCTSTASPVQTRPSDGCGPMQQAYVLAETRPYRSVQPLHLSAPCGCRYANNRAAWRIGPCRHPHFVRYPRPAHEQLQQAATKPERWIHVLKPRDRR